MLILSRQRNESIMIRDDTEVFVTDIQSDKVGLRIVAPDDAPILMKKVWEAIQRKKKQKNECRDQQEIQEPSIGVTDGCAPVLFLKRDDSIMLGDDVEIMIISIRGDKVRLGITALRSIPVYRREVYDAIQRAKS